jgi:hypothetical protein
MFNFPLIDLSVVALVVALTLILALYNRRQAVAIEQIRNLAEDLVAMQIRDRRAKREGSLADLDARAWLEGQAQAVAEKTVKVVSMRTLPAVKAAELTLADQSKILVSILGEAEIKRYDRQQKGGRSRLEAFAAKPVLVGRYQLASRTLLDNEFLDLEASAVAQSLGLDWRNPARLWVYVF